MIPADVRRRLGLESGDRLVVNEEEGSLRLTPLGFRIEKLRGAWAGFEPGRGLVEELIADRRAEAAQE